jgi:HEAT repeats
MPTLLFLRIGAPLIALLAMMSSASTAWADGRVSFLAARLKYPPASGQPDDFRVRTNAALALGTTDSDDAISPLCGALDDPSEVVRQGVAVALKRLAREASRDCLKHRSGIETNASVKSQIKKALDVLDGAAGSGGAGAGGGETPSAANSNAKYYVSVSKVTNNTTRSAADVQRIVGGAITSKLAELGEYQLAPAGESNDAAKAAISRRQLKGYYLGVSVDKLDYSDGNLRVHVKIAVFSYPGRDLRGEVPAGATLPGARPGDSSAEEQLMSVVAARAAELFAQNFR